MLLQEKMQLGFDKMYDENAAKLHAFIFFVINEEKKADELLSKTFLNVWNEKQILNLYPTNSLVFLMQKASQLMLENQNGQTTAIKEKIISYLKMTKRHTPISKVVVPEGRVSNSFNETISIPSA